MKMAVEEINTAGGIHGRKIKLIVEDSGYDPKRAVLASQKMVERDKIFAMVGPMGSPTVLASQVYSRRMPACPALLRRPWSNRPSSSSRETAEGCEFQDSLPYVESTRAAV